MAPRLGIDPVWQTADPQSLPTVRNSLQMTQTPATYRKEPPALGEDTEFIRDWLG